MGHGLPAPSTARRVRSGISERTVAETRSNREDALRDSPLEESGFEPSVPFLRKGLPGVAEGRSRNEWGPD